MMVTSPYNLKTEKTNHNLLSFEENVRNKPNYKIMSLVGRGTFGKVYMAIDLATQEIVAIKRSPKWKNKVSREVELLNQMKYSDHVVKLQSVFYTVTNKGYKIQNCVFKYMNYSLGKYIRLKKQEKKDNKCSRIPPSELKNIIHQICIGMKHLDENNIAHRDLKPDNILIDKTSDLNVRICDLGSAKKVDKSIISIPYICSRWYRAPELLCGSMNYTTEVDLWSLGCIIFELITFCPLFPGKNKREKFKKQSEECSQLLNIMEVVGSPNISFYDSIKNCTDKNNNEFIKELCNLNIPSLSWKSILFNSVNENEHSLIDIIEGLLKWTPNERMKISEVLKNDYFSSCA